MASEEMQAGGWYNSVATPIIEVNLFSACLVAKQWIAASQLHAKSFWVLNRHALFHTLPNKHFVHKMQGLAYAATLVS